MSFSLWRILSLLETMTTSKFPHHLPEYGDSFDKMENTGQSLEVTLKTVDII